MLPAIMSTIAKTQALLRDLPAVQTLLQQQSMQQLALQAGHALTTAGLRHALQAWRERILRGECSEVVEQELLASASDWVQEQRAATLRPVINATGVLIHTNLGRVPLGPAALQAVQDTAAGYSTLEYDLAAGQRSDRYRHCRHQLQELTGAEDAVVVNNNAAALLLTLSALCRDREVVIGRGQLVEIGGGFRIPDILRESGAHLVEVGTTNRTYARDYQAAVTERTAAILCVHASNFRQSGFVHQPSLAALAELTREASRSRGQELWLLHDLGSGNLGDLGVPVLGREQTVADSVAQGAHLTAFSGDKMLGGPQAGILVGRKDLVARLLHHPLLRALRMDKMGLAALTATLDLHLTERALSEIPLLAMGMQSLAQLKARAEAICTGWIAQGLNASVVELTGAVGGGSLPDQDVPSIGVALQVNDPQSVAARLRSGIPPVVSRVFHGQVCLDLRTVLADQDGVLQAAVADCLLP